MRLLGIIDAIESTILDAKRAPFSQNKIILEERVILDLLHKLNFIFFNSIVFLFLQSNNKP